MEIEQKSKEIELREVSINICFHYDGHFYIRGFDGTGDIHVEKNQSVCTALDNGAVSIMSNNILVIPKPNARILLGE